MYVLRRALGPLAGPWAGTLFGLGLFGSAVLTVPILACTVGYAVAHTFGWTGTLDAQFHDARAFYVTILASLLAGAVASLLTFPPIRLLFWASIAGGLGTPITLVLMNCLAASPKTMGAYRIGIPLAVAGWTVTALVTLACLAFLFSL